MAAVALLACTAFGVLSSNRAPALARVPRPVTSAQSTLPLRIDGEWYDVSGWADEHPGGRWLLEYARGRDVTALFHAIHMKNQQKSVTALSRLPRLEASSLPQPSKPCPFPAEVEREQSLQGEYVLAGLYGAAPPETGESGDFNPTEFRRRRRLEVRVA